MTSKRMSRQFNLVELAIHINAAMLLLDYHGNFHVRQMNLIVNDRATSFERVQSSCTTSCAARVR